ncbi:MAG: thiol:disulfide interchange protein DsbA/DsbL [Paucibacter sp.]|nr:thiol:disulfide interchange protein DsbA/DsbL [Roseateles sp.]
MLRREFSALLGLSALPTLALAQGTPTEGRQFTRLNSPQPTPPGKIEVVEFFLYSCPHCYALDPFLQQWSRQVPADVSFKRVHGGFNAMTKLLQRLFYTLEAMGLEAALHERVFAAIHLQNADISSEDGIMKLAQGLGVDMSKFKQTWPSFGVVSKCQTANKVSESYQIQRVPTIAVGGRFVTSPAMAGTPGTSEQQAGAATIPVINHLIGLSRGK